jgi:flagellar basal body-associated protein FliL
MADDKKKDAAPAAPGGEGGGGKKSNLILVIGIVLGIVAVEAAVTFLIAPKPPKNEEEIAQKAKEDSLKKAADEVTKVGATTDDAPIEITVNIAGTDDHFLKTAIIFEYGEKNDKLGEELRRRMPKYRDVMISHMSSLSYKEISDPAERDKIRKDLQRIINASLPTKMGEIKDVLFKTYLIQ